MKKLKISNKKKDKTPSAVVNLSPKKRIVYNAIKQYKKITAAQISNHAKMPTSSVAGRVNELVAMGLITEVGRGRNKNTGVLNRQYGICKVFKKPEQILYKKQVASRRMAVEIFNKLFEVKRYLRVDNVLLKKEYSKNSLGILQDISKIIKK